jgi:hypothetical protein
MKVLDQHADARSFSLRLEAPANSTQMLMLRINDTKIHIRHVEGATIDRQRGIATVQFPPGDGYVQKEVTVSWK